MNGHFRWDRNDSMPRPKRRTSGISGERSSRTSGRGSSGKPTPRPHETEEEAIVRRFHDAQRMARFRAKKKKALEEAQALEAARLAEMAVMSELRRRNVTIEISEPVLTVPSPSRAVPTALRSTREAERISGGMSVPEVPGQTKYSQLLGVIEELGRDVRLTYAGSRTSAERLKMGIVHARLLVRDCLLETEINSRQ